MAKSNVPNSLERRHLIERELPAARALAIAEAYLEAGRCEEAVVFLGKAGAEDRLDLLAREAVEAGDAFLLSEISRVRRREPDPQTWQQLAESARRAGKEGYAETAERQAQRSGE
jgi:predicted Zn-dependent protease